MSSLAHWPATSTIYLSHLVVVCRSGKLKALPLYSHINSTSRSSKVDQLQLNKNFFTM